MRRVRNDRMNELSRLTAEMTRGRLSRREVLQRAALLGISAPIAANFLAACGDDEAEDDVATVPDDAEPDDAEPDDAEPDDAEPDDAEPDDAEPDDAEPDDAEPDDAEPDDAEPDDAEPDDAEPDEEREIVVGAWAGTFAEVLRDTVAPILRERFNATLLVEEGVTEEQLAKMRVGRNNPTHTVMFIDERAVPIARQEDLIEQLSEDDIPNLAEVYPEYIIDDAHGVGVAVSWITAYYNTERIEEPTSCEAWWNPEYQGRIAIPDITIFSPTVEFLTIAASLETGLPIEEALYEIDAGFQKVAELDLHSAYSSFNNITPHLASGEAWLAFGHSRIAGGWIIDGAPIARAPVEEGPFPGINAVVLVKNGPEQDLGAELINIFLSEEVQMEIVQQATAGPVNRNVQPPEELAELVPFGEEAAAEMNQIDWNYANEHSEEWTERYNREILG